MEKEQLSQQELLAKNLVYYRKESGLTQLELAEKFNYSDKSISKWERGEGFPDVFVLKSLADFYGITVDDFYQEEHKKITIKHSQKRKQIYIRLLSFGICWLATIVIFFLLHTLFEANNYTGPFATWLIFIYGAFANAILFLIWEYIYHYHFTRMIAASLVVWTGTLSLFLTIGVLISYMPLMFVVAAVLQILEILWYLFRRKKQKN